MKNKADFKDYYFADGKKVLLQRDGRVALAIAIADRVGIDVGIGERLHSVVLLALNALSEAQRADLADNLVTVFKAGGDILIPSSRVMVDLQKRDDIVQLKAALDISGIAAAITDDNDESVIIEPTSKKPEEAMKLANFLHENTPNAGAAVSFLRIGKRRNRKIA